MFRTLNMEKQKRERSVNFTQEETDILVALAEEKKYIIENKKSDATTWQDKEKAWRDIEEAFNSLSGSVYRDHKHLKLKYEALKRDIRKKCAAIQSESYNGSGINTASLFTPAEQKIKEMILLSDDGNESCIDSDSIIPNASENVFIEIVEHDSEPPRKKVCDTSPGKVPSQCKPKVKRKSDKLTEEKIEIANIQKKILKEELEQKWMQRKLLEQELSHKDAIYNLEKQHLLLKIELLKKELERKDSEEKS